MAGHPYGHLRDHKVQHHRAAEIAHEHGTPKAVGGAGHSDLAEDRALIHKMVKQSALRATGGAVKARADRPSRRAKGGRAHSDVAEDKKLIKKMLAAHEKKEMKVEGNLRHRARGGFIPAIGKRRKKPAGSKHTTNVIVAPHNPMPMPMARPPMVPGAAPPMPPPMPPAGAMARPSMPPGPPGPMGPLGAAPPPGVAPPMLPRKRGGAVFSEDTRGSFTTKARMADADKTNYEDQSSAGIGKGRTPIRKSFPTNKQQPLGNVGRGPVITKATGGPIISDSKAGVDMGPKFTGGSRGAMARLEKAARLARSKYGRETISVANPTQNPKV